MDTLYQNWPPKKRAIIEATISIVAKEGFARTTTARIAQDAKAGEGSIYRHFKNKDDLLNMAAQVAAQRVFGPARQNYNPDASIHAQFIRFCKDFLRVGKKIQPDHQYLEQYLNSPLGIAYRKNVIRQMEADHDIQPIFYPLNAILLSGIKHEILKDLPVPYLVGLSMGPMAFILKNSAQGFMELSDDKVETIANSCWDAIRR